VAIATGACGVEGRLDGNGKRGASAERRDDYGTREKL
jgi:hypothetical protein